MKIETAIERLQAMVNYETSLAGEDNIDEDLRDLELDLEALRMAKRALEGALGGKNETD